MFVLMSEWASGIRKGMTGQATVVVTKELTVGHLLPFMPKVYSTPMMIFLMETAAGNAIQPALPNGWVSVGVDVSVRHTAATPVGHTAVAKATVTAVGEKLVEFEVEAWDGATLIGKGTHSRAPIELARFMARLTG
jgi:fluoroacetyl-CoA thioesterase